jgi:hypothetical protein
MQDNQSQGPLAPPINGFEFIIHRLVRKLFIKLKPDKVMIKFETDARRSPRRIVHFA